MRTLMLLMREINLETHRGLYRIYQKGRHHLHEIAVRQSIHLFIYPLFQR